MDEGWPSGCPGEVLMRELLSYARRGIGLALSGYFDERPQLAMDVGTDGKGESMTILMAAANGGSISVIKLCLEHGASLHAMNALGKTALHFAAERAQSETVLFLLQHGADPNLRTLDSPGHPEGNMTPLMFAATSRAGDEKCISTMQALLDASNNINERGPGGATAIWLACKNGRKKIVRALLHSGADLWIYDDRGVMPCQAARESGAKRCVRYMEQFQGAEETWYRAYLMYRISCIREAFTTRVALPNAPLPPYLGTRAMGVKDLPIVEIASRYRGTCKRTRERLRNIRARDAEVTFVLDDVTRYLTHSLFVELMMYF